MALGSLGPYFRVARKWLGPAWLVSNGDSELVGYVVDVVRDAFVERLRHALLFRFPQQDPTGTPAPDDALAAIGRDRRITRGLFEIFQGVRRAAASVARHVEYGRQPDHVTEAARSLYGSGPDLSHGRREGKLVLARERRPENPAQLG